MRRHTNVSSRPALARLGLLALVVLRDDDDQTGSSILDAVEARFGTNSERARDRQCRGFLRRSLAVVGRGGGNDSVRVVAHLGNIPPLITQVIGCLRRQLLDQAVVVHPYRNPLVFGTAVSAIGLAVGPGIGIGVGPVTGSPRIRVAVLVRLCATCLTGGGCRRSRVHRAGCFATLSGGSR